MESNKHAEYFMNGIYVTDDSIKSLFEQWADKNVYLRKYKYGNDSFILYKYLEKMI